MRTIRDLNIEILQLDELMRVLADKKTELQAKVRRKTRALAKEPDVIVRALKAVTP